MHTLLDHQQHDPNQPSAAVMFATRRQDRGLQCSSVQWGPWASGLALSDPAILHRFERAGLGALPGGCCSKQGFSPNGRDYTRELHWCVTCSLICPHYSCHRRTNRAGYSARCDCPGQGNGMPGGRKHPLGQAAAVTATRAGYPGGHRAF